MFTVDANVFVRDLNPNDAEYAACHALLEQLRITLVPVICPAIVLPEIAGAVSRETGDFMRSRISADMVANSPYVSILRCDDALVQQATELAADH